MAKPTSKKNKTTAKSTASYNGTLLENIALKLDMLILQINEERWQKAETKLDAIITKLDKVSDKTNKNEADIHELKRIAIH